MARPKHRTRPGGTYFITTETAQRHRIFQNHRAARICEDKLIEYRDRGFYLLHRYTVMPDHLHAILTPAETTTLEKALQLVKGGSSHEVNKALLRQFPVWQPGFTEHLIRDQPDYDLHVRYIDENPVKAGLSAQPEKYPFCSASSTHRMDPRPPASGAIAHNE